MGALRQVELPDGRTIEYVIDSQGRRVGKKVDGLLQWGLLYQGSLRPVAQLDASGAVVSRFVYGTRVNVPEYVLRGGVIYRVVTDHLGSVRMVVDVSSGAVMQRMEYDAYGVVVVGEVEAGWDPLPFGFGGGIYDRDTGLVRFGAGDYDAGVGRWTVKDPIGFGGGDTHLYAYVFGDPINLVDQNGEHAAAVLAVGAGLALAPIVVPVAVGVGALLFVTTFASDTGIHEQDWYAKKRDIRQVEEIIKRVGVDREQRRRLHDEITRRGLDLDEIEQIAKEIKEGSRQNRSGPGNDESEANTEDPNVCE